MNAIMRKSIIFAIRSPYKKVDFPTENVNVFKSPVSCNASPTSGVIISDTNAVTSLEAAAPITNAMASQIIPNFCRKSMNSWIRLFFGGGWSDIQYVKPESIYCLS